MPQRVPWREQAVNVDVVCAGQVLEGLKSFDITHIQAIPCSLCSNAHHKMRYLLLECSSETCREAGTFKCAWRGKRLTCSDTNEECINEFGVHTSSATSPKEEVEVEAKAFCREMATHHLRPTRIHHALSRKFDTPLEDLPSQSTVQNFVNYYSRTYLENHDRVDHIKSWVHANAYNGSGPLTQAFTFGWELKDEGNQVVGNGSDERPFMVGTTTKALMLRMMLPSGSIVQRFDATYKMNQCDYLVLVVGVSDSSRAFHLVALFVFSQDAQGAFEAAVLALRRLYYWITQKELVIQYARADADQAQYNTHHSLFGGYSQFQFLMCFFHLIENVHKEIKTFLSGVAAVVVHDIHDLHFAQTPESFSQLRDAVLRHWLTDPALV